MSTVELPGPPPPRAILVYQGKLPSWHVRELRDQLKDAYRRNDWPLVLATDAPVYWLPVGDQTSDLLYAAYAYINHFVDASQAEIDGFDVEAWCSAVEGLEAVT